jgi:hypothetical protein
MIPKIGSFVDIVLSYDNQEFRRNFRLSRDKYSSTPGIFPLKQRWNLTKEEICN